MTELWGSVFAGDPPRNAADRVIARKLRVQRELFFVAESEGRLVGTVIAGYDGYRGWVYHLAVHPDDRRRGIGGDLMHAAERALRALGCPKVNLQVRAGNEAILRFYESLGYDVEERISMGKLLE